jgi:cytochrome c biogenesis protein CcdA
MFLRKVFSFIICVLIFLAFSLPAFAKDGADQANKLIVFHSQTCHECVKAKSEILPQIENSFRGKIIFEYRDLSDIENYKLMLALQEKYSAKEMKSILPVFFLNGKFLNGEFPLKKRLEDFIAQAFNPGAKERVGLPVVNLIERFKAFKPLAIIGLGLVDGINPCAFTVIVFFMSFLVLQGYKRRELALVGLSFVSAIFVTYLLIGLGLFSFVYRIEAFWLIRKIFNIAIGIFSILLGIFSVYDFLKFKMTNKTEGLLLQLPQAVKNRMHYIIGLHYRKTKQTGSEESTPRKHIFRLIVSAFITGFLISIIEAVCTGQTYLPTVVFIFKATNLKLEALTYLLLYNIMFIVPLLVIFVFTLAGTASEQFSAFLKKNLSLIKLVLAVVFFAMGIFLIWRA